ncbi:hypothetical protein PIB30_113311, partial [Stylosanthes scabra]|nr:hypothetical protein [Stylosanthes scabra]
MNLCGGVEILPVCLLWRLFERVVMLNREISQQAEANARRVAALESTVQSQSQEVSDLRKAYADV